MDGLEIDEMVGETLKRLRKTAGLTQEAIAERSGKSYQQYQRYEWGVNRLTISQLFAMAKVLDIEPHAIIKLVEHAILAKQDFSKLSKRRSKIKAAEEVALKRSRRNDRKK